MGVHISTRQRLRERIPFRSRPDGGSANCGSVTLEAPVRGLEPRASTPAVTLDGVQGFDAGTSVYAPATGVLSNMYLVLYSSGYTFDNNGGNKISIDGGTPSAANVNWQSAYQVNVSPSAITGFAAGSSHDIAVVTPVGTSNSMPFKMAGSSRDNLACTAAGSVSQTQGSTGASETFTLNALGGSGSYSWTASDSGYETFHTVSQNPFTVTFATPGTYTVSLLDEAPTGGPR